MPAELIFGVGARLDPSVQAAFAQISAQMARLQTGMPGGQVGWAGVTPAQVQTLNQATRSMKEYGTATAATAKPIKDTAAAAGGLNENLRGFLVIAKRVVAAYAIIETFQQLSGAIRSGIDAAYDFNKGLGLVNTVLKTTPQELEKLGLQIRAISVETGTLPNEAVLGYYQVLSANIHDTGLAMQFVERGAKAAKAGVSTVDEAITAGIRVWEAYGKKGYDVTRIYDLMFHAVDEGILLFKDLASNVGRVADSFSNAGISLEELSAEIAIMSRHVTPQQVFTALENSLRSFLKPGKQAKDLAAELGIGWNIATLRSKGLAGAIGELAEATKKQLGPSATANQIMDKTMENLAVMMPTIRGIRGWWGIVNDGIQLAAKGITDYKASQDDLNKAFQAMMQEWGPRVDVMKAAWNEFKLTLGEGIVEAWLPALEKAFGKSTTDIKGLRLAALDLADTLNVAGAEIGIVFLTLVEAIQSVQLAWAELRGASTHDIDAIKSRIQTVGQTLSALYGIIEDPTKFTDPLRKMVNATENLSLAAFAVKKDLPPALQEAATAGGSAYTDTMGKAGAAAGLAAIDTTAGGIVSGKPKIEAAAKQAGSSFAKGFVETAKTEIMPPWTKMIETGLWTGSILLLAKGGAGNLGKVMGGAISTEFGTAAGVGFSAWFTKWFGAGTGTAWGIIIAGAAYTISTINRMFKDAQDYWKFSAPSQSMILTPSAVAKTPRFGLAREIPEIQRLGGAGQLPGNLQKVFSDTFARLQKEMVDAMGPGGMMMDYRKYSDAQAALMAATAVQEFVAKQFAASTRESATSRFGDVTHQNLIRATEAGDYVKAMDILRALGPQAVNRGLPTPWGPAIIGSGDYFGAPRKPSLYREKEGTHKAFDFQIPPGVSREEFRKWLLSVGLGYVNEPAYYGKGGPMYGLEHVGVPGWGDSGLISAGVGGGGGQDRNQPPSPSGTPPTAPRIATALENTEWWTRQQRDQASLIIQRFNQGAITQGGALAELTTLMIGAQDALGRVPKGPREAAVRSLIDGLNSDIAGVWNLGGSRRAGATAPPPIPERRPSETDIGDQNAWIVEYTNALAKVAEEDLARIRAESDAIARDAYLSAIEHLPPTGYFRPYYPTPLTPQQLLNMGLSPLSGQLPPELGSSIFQAMRIPGGMGARINKALQNFPIKGGSEAFGKIPNRQSIIEDLGSGFAQTFESALRRGLRDARFTTEELFGAFATSAADIIGKSFDPIFDQLGQKLASGMIKTEQYVIEKTAKGTITGTRMVPNWMGLAGVVGGSLIGGAVGGSQQGALTGALLGGIFGPIGAVFGGILGGIFGPHGNKIDETNRNLRDIRDLTMQSAAFLSNMQPVFGPASAYYAQRGPLSTSTSGFTWRRQWHI